MKISIYKLYFTNGRSYIGASNSFTQRYAEHVRLLRNGCHSNYKVQKEYSSLQELPKIEVLGTFDSSIATEAEDYYILRYGTLNIKRPNYIPKAPVSTETSTHVRPAYRVQKPRN